MKNHTSLMRIALSLVFFSSICFSISQAQQEKRFVLKIDPAKLLGLGAVHVGAEYGLSNKISIQFAGQFQKKLSSTDKAWLQNRINNLEDGGDASINSFEIQGRDVIASLRFYPAGQSLSPKGFFLGFFARHSNYDLNAPGTLTIRAQGQSETVETEFDLNIKGPAIGLEFGGQWIISDIISLELFAGLGAMLGSENGQMTLGPTSQFTDAERADAATRLADELNNEFQQEGIGKFLDISFSSQADEVFTQGNFKGPAFRAGITLGIAL